MVTAENQHSEWQGIYEELRERMEEESPPAWLWEQDGLEVFGTVVSLTAQAPTSYGSAPVVVLRVPPSDELRSVWLLHTVLRNEFLRQRPEPGEQVLIRCLGKIHPEGGGPSYLGFRLRVHRPEAGATWQDLAERYGEPEREPVEPEPEDIPF